MRKKESVKDAAISPSAQSTDIFTSLLAAIYAPATLFVDKTYRMLYRHGNVGTYLKLPATYVGCHLTDLLEGEELTLIKAGIDKVLQNKKPVLLEDIHWHHHEKEYVLNLNIRLFRPPGKDDPLVLVEFHQSKSVPLKQQYSSAKGLDDRIRLLEAQLEDKENEILECNRKLELVLHTSQIGVWERDLKNDIAIWDKRTQAIFGFFDKEFDGRLETFFHTIYHEDVPKVQQAYQLAIQEDKPYNIECRIVWEDHSIHHIISKGVTVRDDNNEVVKMLGTCMDITALAQSQAQLHLSEERLVLAINGASAGLWDWPDVKSPNVWWSPKFYELLGMYDGEIEANDDNFKKLVHPDDYLATLEDVEQQKYSHIDADLRIFHKTEGYKWFRNRAQIFRDQQGKVVRMAGAIIDIKKRKLAESQLYRTNLKLKKANEYLDNFVFTVAHDLRAPVANLKSLVALFKLQVNDHDPIVSRIDLSVERLEQTLRGLVQILDVQKVENKAAIIIKFSEVLDKILKEMEEVVNNCHVMVYSDFQEEKISYIAPYLESIIRNLLSNSIKYASKEQPPHIYIRSLKEKEFILLEVEDNGIGIDLNRFKHKIFKPFEKLSHKSSGQGIGLHLIKTMAEKNGGKVGVKSRPNEGTIFRVYLKPYTKYERKKESTYD